MIPYGTCVHVAVRLVANCYILPFTFTLNNASNNHWANGKFTSPNCCHYLSSLLLLVRLFCVENFNGVKAYYFFKSRLIP